MKRHEQAEAILNQFLAECGEDVPSQREVEPILDRVWETLQGRADTARNWTMAEPQTPPLRYAWAAGIVLVAALVSAVVWRQGPPFAGSGGPRADEHAARFTRLQRGESLQVTLPEDVFEVASVKLVDPSSEAAKSAAMSASFGEALTGCATGSTSGAQVAPRRLTIPAISVFSLVMIAYGKECELVEGGPAWVRSSDAYEIQALLPAGTPQYTQENVQKGEAPRLQGTLQNLLADRFRLVLKRELREMPVYALTVANREKIKVSPPGETRASSVVMPGFPVPQLRRGQMLTMMSPAGEMQLSGHAMSIPDLAKHLRQGAGRIVVDKTGLTEVIDVELKFTRDTPMPLLPGAPVPPPNAIPPLPGAAVPGPRLGTALQEQLGLKLEPARMPIEILTIQSVERPSEN